MTPSPAPRMPAIGLLLSSLLIVGGPASAQSPEDHSTPPALLAAACANCHGSDGRGAWPIASIAGRPYTELLRQLTAYRNGESLDDATVMPRLMAGYSATEIETLARWFSSLPVTPETAAETTP